MGTIASVSKEQDTGGVATERKMSRSRSVLSIFSNEFILVYFQ